jgi:arylsulfatase A-like enzyme
MEIWLGLAFVALASQAALAVDLNGPWRLEVYVTRLALTFDDVCALTVSQTGSVFAATGSCSGAAHPVSLQGTVDPDTGALSGSGTIGACAAIVFSGSVASTAASFSGEFQCSSIGVSGGIHARRCGNGQIDDGEACDDGERNGGCCTRDCVLLPAGTGCADDGSQCTSDLCNATGDCVHTPLTGFCIDHNSCTQGDRCVNGLCVGTPRPDSSPCDDGNQCTTGDHCAAGICVADPVECAPCFTCSGTLGCVSMIANGCKQSPTSSLILKHRSADAVAWNWEDGDATSAADLGHPMSTTDYDLCIFDGSAGSNGISPLVFGARAPAGADWAPTSNGYRYSRPDLSPGGVRRILANTGAAQQARMTVKARGPNFTLPPLQALTLPLRVQLTARDGSSSTCWSAEYDQTRARSGRRITAQVQLDAPSSRPNILLIDLDDTRGDGIDRMPNVAALAAQGVTFTNSFAVSPLCAPSRATLVTGLSSEHHGVRALNGPIGGAHLLREQGTDRQTAATWLQAAGYRTGLFGKYVNGYGFGASEQSSGPGGTYYVPPGWTRWRAMTSPEHYGGVNGVAYTLVDEHGLPTVYADHDTDAEYSTDLLAAEVRTFIADSVDEKRPFFAVWTPYASHNETTLLPEPAARHYGFFADLPPWRPPSWAEADVSDKPQIVQSFGTDPSSIALTDRMRIGAYESLLAVDEQLRVIQDQLAELGIAQNTVIIVTSDNGVCWGEHRLFIQAKDCLYEECLRVPLIIYDPRASGAAALQPAPALNIDLAPTVAALAGVEPPVAVDGVSLTPWVTGPPPAQWRSDFLGTHWRALRDDLLAYTGHVADGDQVRLYYGDSRVLPRPSVLFEFDANGSVSSGARRVVIGPDEDASFANLANAVPGQVPFTSTATVPSLNQLKFIDGSPDSSGVFIVVERNQAGVIRRVYAGTDVFGVRDVSNGFSYVQYETGEVELYDLHLDPAQLDNKASDPTYAATRARLAERLRELLQ